MGIEQTDLLQQSIGFVVRHVEIDNLHPGRFNDLLCISSQIVELKRASLTFRQEITNQSNNKLASALIRIACVDLAKMKPLAIPQPILGELTRVV